MRRMRARKNAIDEIDAHARARARKSDQAPRRVPRDRLRETVSACKLTDEEVMRRIRARVYLADRSRYVKSVYLSGKKREEGQCI